MLINSNSSDFTEDSSVYSENESILAGFKDDNICGEGATCRVYQMKLQGLHVAVKRLREDYIGDPIHHAAFRKEFSIGQQLKHDALPVYRDLRDDDKEVYIIMDFIDGVSVDNFLNKEAGQRYFQSKDNVRRFFSDLVGVVGYLHRKGVIHCDIKPANIMLRLSDRGVMLIDLDKAYSDSLDNTSGGSSGFSNPVESGEKPTARKDFIAIGKLLDYISDNTPHFPKSLFKRFRSECDNPETTPEKLIAALRHKSHTGLWTCGVLLSICILCGIGYYTYLNLSESNDSMSSGALTDEAYIEIDTLNKNEDNIGVPQRLPAPAPVTGESGKPLISVTDFDSRMIESTRIAREYLTALSAGSLSDSRIQDMMSKIIDSYSSNYQVILSEYKAANPDVYATEVELAIAKASERSDVTKLYQQFIQAARDTIVARHPESYSDE